MSYKLTIDITLVTTTASNAALDVLKRWKKEGKLEFDESEPSRNERSPAKGWPGAPPPMDEKRPRVRPKKESSSGPNFRNVAAVLFPYKDSQKLNMTEINDVAHLIRHHGSKNQIFVTQNKTSFIENGKRDLLKAYFGILALTPEETVEMLSRTEGWK